MALVKKREQVELAPEELEFLLKLIANMYTQASI